MHDDQQLNQVFSSIVATSTEYDTTQTERGNTITVEDENVTVDSTESGTATFAEAKSGTTPLSNRDIRTSFSISLIENGASSTDNEKSATAFMRGDSSIVTEMSVANVTKWNTSGTDTWSGEVSASSLSGSVSDSGFGSSPFVVNSTSAVPSAFHSTDSLTGWFRSSAPVSCTLSPFNDTTALNDTDDWDLYGGGLAWGPGAPRSIDTLLDGYPYPSLYGWAHIVVASIVVTAIMLLIVLGNVLVIVAVARDRNLSGIQNWFITSLALSDLFVGLFIMPLSLSYELMGYWTFGNVLCELWLCTDVMLCTASILNLVLISLDRYWSITRAVSYVRQRTRRRAVLMIGAVWAMSIIISLPPLVGWKRPQPTKFGYPLCVLSEEPGYVVYSTIGSFYLPLVVMVMVYLKIYLAARNRARRNLGKLAPVEGNHCKTTRPGATATSTPLTNPGGKHKGTATGRLSPTREMSSGSTSPPPGRLPSSVAQGEPEEMEAEVAQVTIESVSPSTQSPVGGDPSTALTLSADPSPVVVSSFDVDSIGRLSPLVVASTVVHSADVASSVVQPSGFASSVVQPPSVDSSVVVSLHAVQSSYVAPSVVQSSNVASFVGQSSEVTSSVVESSYVDPSIGQSSYVDPSVLQSSYVDPSVGQSSYVDSSVLSSVVHSPPAVPSSAVPSVAASPTVHSSASPSFDIPPSATSPSVAPSSFRARPQRIIQARRSSTGTADSSPPPPTNPSSASRIPASAAAEPSQSERRRSAMSNRRPCVASSMARVRSIPRCNGVKDVERMKRKMARSRERRATLVLGIVMASFIGCWLPFFSLYPITLLVGLQLPDKLFAVIFWLGYCNSALNPIIYTIFNRDFRLAFQRILFSRRTKSF